MSAAPSGKALGFRPTYRIPLALTPEAVVSRLREHLDDSPRRFESRWAGRHLLLALPARERRPWSPWLFVDVRAAGDTGADTEADAGTEADAERDAPEVAGGSAVVVARFGPHPQLWTGTALALMALAVLALFSLALAWAQVLMERSPWATWLLGAVLAAAASLWLGGQLGQRLARDQLEELWALLEEALELPDQTA